jgi:hypothetical protein
VKICIDKNSVVKYASEGLIYTGHGLKIGNRVDPFLTADNSEILNVNSLPEPFTVNRCKYINGAFVADEDLVLESNIEKKSQLITKIHEYREEKLSAGMPYDFLDGISGVVQLRDEIDFRNITGMGSAGLALVVTESDALIEFRDESNTSHMLTGAEAMGLGIAATLFVNEIYQQSWSKKKELDETSDLDNFDYKW